MTDNPDESGGRPPLEQEASSEPPSVVPTIESYAELNAALATGRDPDAVFAEHGLTEPEWESVDTYWQSELSKAMDRQEDGVPPLVEQYAQRLSEARSRGHDLSLAPMSLEMFGKATGAIRRRGDPRAALSELGVELTVYMRASSYWTTRIARDRRLSDEFMRAQGDGDALADLRGAEALAKGARSDEDSGGTDK